MVQATISICHVAVLIKDCVLSIMVQIREHVPVLLAQISRLVNKFLLMTATRKFPLSITDSGYICNIVVLVRRQFSHTMQTLLTDQLSFHFVMQKAHVVHLVKPSLTLIRVICMHLLVMTAASQFKVVHVQMDGVDQHVHVRSHMIIATVVLF